MAISPPQVSHAGVGGGQGAAQPGSQPSWIRPWGLAIGPAVCLKQLNPSGPQFPLLQKRDCRRRSASPKHLSLHRRQAQASTSWAF